jgi:hypothetical protein
MEFLLPFIYSYMKTITSMLLIISVISICCTGNGNNTKLTKAFKANNNTADEQLQMFNKRIDSLCNILPPYLTKKNFNKYYVLIADLSMHSGLNRMVLINVVTKKIIDSGVVAHGCGSSYFAETAVFSNVPNSYCSSFGKYKIGAKYDGNFGKSYKLHGLETSNSKAFDRLIVLHPYKDVPETAVYPEYIMNSQGCPMVSNGYLKRLSTVIDASKKPLLLWIIK